MLLTQVARYVFTRLNGRDTELVNLVVSKSRNGSLDGEPLVSVIIPTRDKLLLLKKCITSLIERTNYRNFELIVVDNGSVEPETLDYLRTLGSNQVKVISFPEAFNYSKICNFASTVAKGDYLCLLNNDTYIHKADWLSDLLGHATSPNVGVVGAKLLYPNGLVQHSGIALGKKGVASHPYRGKQIETTPNECFEVEAVTFACALISKSTFLQLNGLDEKFPVGLNDVDFCIRATRAGYVNVLCSKCLVNHSESMSRPSMNSIHGVFQAYKDVIRYLRIYGSTAWVDRYFK